MHTAAGYFIVASLVSPGLKVVGFAMYYFTYDPWVGKQLYLEDFYVMEPYRGKSLVRFTFTCFLAASLLMSSLLFRLSFLLPGLGIGSELLRHLSDVSTEPKLLARHGVRTELGARLTLVPLPAGDKDALHGHDVHRGGEQRDVHPVLQAARCRGPLSGGRLEALQVQQEQPGQDGHSG